MRLLILSPILLLPTPATSDYIKDKPAEMALIAPADPDVIKLSTGYCCTEGPVWDPAHGYLILSDIDGDRMWRLTLPGSAGLLQIPAPGQRQHPRSSGQRDYL